MVPRRHVYALVARPMVALAALAISVSSCEPSSPSFQLHIRNMDGPTVKVLVAGVELATVRCGTGLALTPQTSPPWDVVIVDATTSEQLFRREFSDAPDQEVVIRSDGASAGPWPMPGGPAPATTCPPEGSG